MWMDLPDSGATESFGARLASCCTPGTTIFLYGDLGAGKTTLVRGFLHALGHRGAVRSPTYTLVEPYQTARLRVHHFDLYRLGDPEELEFLGIRDYFDGTAVSLVEWPQQGMGFLPPPDLSVFLEHRQTQRRLRLESAGARGDIVLDCLARGGHP